MIITNKTGLPDVFVKAVENDTYNKGDADYSVTELLKPAYMSHLQKQHDGDIVEDVSDMIFRLTGQLMHTLLERAGETEEYITEKRYFAELFGYTVSGQIDVYQPAIKTISDYKFTTIYKLKDTTDFEQQLNILRYLAIKNGVEVDRLQVVMMFRDWFKTQAQIKPDYPDTQVKIVELPVWSMEQTESFIIDRIKEHLDPVPCTDIERWATGECYAVQKKGVKKAVRLLETEQEALDYIVKNNVERAYIEHRPPTYKRCDNYCTVKQWCKYYKTEEV